MNLDKLLANFDRWLCDLHFDLWLNFDCTLLLDIIDKIGFIVRGVRFFMEYGIYDGAIDYPYAIYALAVYLERWR